VTHADPAEVELLILDVDGVLTDGRIVIDDMGRESKSFSARDGMGVTLWRRSGREVAIITGRRSLVVTHRARELGIRHVYQGWSDKAAALAHLLETVEISAERTAHIGDDLPDLAVMRRVGYPIAVGDAAPQVREAAAFVTERRGGHGAVREAIEHLLSAAGDLETTINAYEAT
jgi:3-deoxy-D-manno-octulosonate 8-phosphate phosphatase (KDO 8-P phosphatase)